MTLTKRERQLAIAFLVAGSVFALDAVALKPYIAHRTALLDQHSAKSKDLADARETIVKERRLRKVLAGLGQFVASDTSGAEGQFLHLLHGWEKEAGVGKASFQRLRATELDGFTHLTFHVTATGRMPAIAMLLYRVEAAPIPLRVDDVQITPKKETGDELQVQMIVSTLCRKGEPAKRATQEQVALDSATGGGRPQ
jgi:hypothetical protein